MKKYKVLKDFVDDFDRGPTFHKAGIDWSVHINKYDVTTEFISMLEVNGFIKKIPDQLKTVWDLKEGDKYWVITSDGEIDPRSVNYMHFEEEHREIGNAFLTKEEAEKELVRRKAKVILERDTEGFKPDWKNSTQCKYEVYYDYDCNEFFTSESLDAPSHNLWFGSIEDAEHSIKAHEKEWKIYLGVE